MYWYIVLCLNIRGQGRLPRNSFSSRGNGFPWNRYNILIHFVIFLYGLFVLASTQPETRLRHLSSQVSLPLLLRGLSLRTRRVGLFQIRLELSRRALVTGFEAPIPQPKCAGVLRSQRKLLKLHDLGTEKRFNASGLRPSSLQGASTEWKPNNKETRAQLALLALFCIVL